MMSKIESTPLFCGGYAGVAAPGYGDLPFCTAPFLAAQPARNQLFSDVWIFFSSANILTWVCSLYIDCILVRHKARGADGAFGDGLKLEEACV